MSIIVASGPAGLSDFRIERVAERLRSGFPGAVIHGARAIYLIEIEASPATPVDRLFELLGAEEGAVSALAADEWLVLPRLGTRSPWGSKAADILRQSGIEVSHVEHGMAWQIEGIDDAAGLKAAGLLHDPMTESLVRSIAQASRLFETPAARPLRYVEANAIQVANREFGLGLADDAQALLAEHFADAGRPATDAELMMFAQANSEHCRHRIFNAAWRIDGEATGQTLFGMIRNTHAKSPALTLSAYRDNAAVIASEPRMPFRADPNDGVYGFGVRETGGFAIKVETHNHPTAIAPYPGAATGSGGEIRDEAATGRGATPRIGLTGFSVSQLRIPQAPAPYETDRPLDPRLASAFEIMRDAPLGAAAFNNEFGRPAVAGYFRSFEQAVEPGLVRGYDKPIMLAGGIGAIDAQFVAKAPLADGDLIVVLGGPGYLIGLGGGAASSVAAGASSDDRDFASVQRDQAEMQRRCQQVIDGCIALAEHNPIQSIHDVGAGGLSNAIPELLHDAELGGVIELDSIPRDDPSMSPMELWSNESQERYVLGIRPGDRKLLDALAVRERCPIHFVGVATTMPQLVLKSTSSREVAVDLPMAVLFGGLPQLAYDVGSSRPARLVPLATRPLDLQSIALEVLAHPTVGSKQFLVTIGDRSVGGLVCRDQMVGPWQVPVADYGACLDDFVGFSGQAMAIGERSPLALANAAASARMAVGEAVTNLAGAAVPQIGNVRLSANWMAAPGFGDEAVALFDAVRAVGLELCPDLGISIPVGKDSLSMVSRFEAADGAAHCTVAPVSLVVTAFAALPDVRLGVTPLLEDEGDSELWLIGLGAGRQRLGGSILAQCLDSFGAEVPDLDEPQRLADFFALISDGVACGVIRAYHDRSDGGAFATLVEMAFASRCGLEISLDNWGDDPFATLFAEELGGIVQIRAADRVVFADRVQRAGLTHCAQRIGRPIAAGEVRVLRAGATLAQWSFETLARAWWRTSHAMARRRDEPTCADEELATATDFRAPPLYEKLPADFAVAFAESSIADRPDRSDRPASPAIRPDMRRAAPRVAIFREQGVNGHVEMAAAFHRAGFVAVDVNMEDLLTGRHKLDAFAGMAACGGFSYGDVLGAGRGWATAILGHTALRSAFEKFFARPETFTLGVCNGCQMLSQLRDLIPGAAQFPAFLRNRSEQYEARLAQVEVLESPSVLLRRLQGARLPVVVAHGEGRVPESPGLAGARPALRFVGTDSQPATMYPANPNGSAIGLTGFTSDDGRATIVMPHPERTFRAINLSWTGRDRSGPSPWAAVFADAFDFARGAQ